MSYYNCSAIKGFDRSNIADYSAKSTKPVFLKTAFGSVKQKSLLAKFRFVEHVTNAALKASGFFIAASDASDNTPEWVSCTEYTGHIAPYASLAALIKRLHNLLESKRHNDLNVERIYPLSALSFIQSIKGYCGAGSIFNSYAP